MAVKATVQWHTIHSGPNLDSWAVICTVNAGSSNSAPSTRVPANVNEHFDGSTLPWEANRAVEEVAADVIQTQWSIPFDPATDRVKFVNPFVIL